MDVHGEPGPRGQDQGEPLGHLRCGPRAQQGLLVAGKRIQPRFIQDSGDELHLARGRRKTVLLVFAERGLFERVQVQPGRVLFELSHGKT